MPLCQVQVGVLGILCGRQDLVALVTMCEAYLACVGCQGVVVGSLQGQLAFGS